MRTANKNSNTIDSKISLFSIVMSLLFIAFTYQNCINSALIGNYNSERKVVYILLFLIILFELSYFLFSKKGFLRIHHLSKSFFFLSLYIVFVDIINNVNYWNIIVHCMTLILFMLTYNYIRESLNNSRYSIRLYNKLLIFLFVIFTFLSFVAQKDITNIRGESFAVLNLSYYCLCLLPFILSLDNKKIKSIGLIMCVVVTLLSFKRGAIITMFLMFLGYIIVDGIINHKKFMNITKLLLILFASIILIGIINQYSNNYLLNRFGINSLLDGSGRHAIQQKAIESIKNRGVIQLLFGLGSGSTTNNLGITTHNDYIEFLYCFGIVGLVLYIKHGLIVINNFLISLKKHDKHLPYYFMLMLFCFGLSLFEGVIFNFINLYVIIVLAIFDNYIILYNEEKNGDADEKK